MNYSKKRYAAIEVKVTGDSYEALPKPLLKGISVKRRDFCHYTKEALMEILQTGLRTNDPVQVQEKVQLALKGLEEAPFQKLVISKKLAASYKGPLPAHAQLAERRRNRGENVSVGERVPFVFVKVAGKVKGQGDRIEDPSYATHKKLRVDSLYYLQHQIQEPLLQLAEPFLPSVKVLVEEYSRGLSNRQGGQKELTSFFKPKDAPKQADAAYVRKRKIDEVSDFGSDDEELEAPECLL